MAVMMAPLQQNKKPSRLVNAPFETSFRANFADDIPNRPGVLETLHERAMARFDELGFPTRRSEAWKYIQLTPLLSMHFEPFTDIEAGVLHASIDQLKQEIVPHFLPETVGQRLVFVNGKYFPELSDCNPSQVGFLIADLKTVLRDEPDLLEPFVTDGLSEENDPFAVLNTAAFTQGACVYVQRGVQVERPVQVIFYTTLAGIVAEKTPETAKAAYFRNVIVAEPKASVSIVVQCLGASTRANIHGKDGQRSEEAFVSEGTNRPTYFNNIVQRVYAQEEAQVQLSYIQMEQPEAWQFASTCSLLSQGSRLEMTTVALGSHIGRHSIEAKFLGEQAHCTLNGLSVLRGHTEIYNPTVIHHAKPNNTSQQLYKNILDDHARSEFNGTVKVAVDADGTDSQQLNKNLLLSENARVFTRPQLQILADDVKCAHGATVGQLEQEHLFYLASRGLDPELAQCLLTYGFAEEIIQALPLASLRQYLDRYLLTQLDQAQSPLGCNLACHTCDQ